ncbi:MAG: ketoacyl-ACP synthase III [Pirellulaceae bacterium]|nr:ketoacyl-ACP synthase III [Pirellulaceae bacterium]
MSISVDSTNKSDASPARSGQVSGRSRLGQLTGIEIMATGSYVPEAVVANEDLAELGCDSEWIVQRTGIRQRRRASPEQATSDLALRAAEQCLQRAGVSPSEVDLIVVATITPDHATPSTACHLQRALGCVAPAMDVNAACAGFMYALVTAGQFVANGSAKCALVVGAEVMSRTVNPADQKTYPLFGDGAGAVLLRATEDRSKGLLSYTLGAEGCGGQLLSIPSGGSRMPLTAEAIAAGDHYLRMEGRSVFKWAVRVVSDSLQDCLTHARLDIGRINLMILHQANMRIIDSAVSDFGFDRNKVFVNLERYGNTSAASIPLALDEALTSGALKPGELVMLCGFGSGLAWGTAIWQL